MFTHVILLPKSLATLNLGSKEYFSQQNIMFRNIKGYVTAEMIIHHQASILTQSVPADLTYVKSKPAGRKKANHFSRNM
jgi:hypothetical protein